MEGWEEYSPFIHFIQFDDLSVLKVVRKPAGMKLNLVNMNDDLIEAWHEAFSLYPREPAFIALDRLVKNFGRYAIKTCQIPIKHDLLPAKSNYPLRPNSYEHQVHGLFYRRIRFKQLSRRKFPVTDP